MGYQFKVDRPIPADVRNIVEEVSWRKNNAPFFDLMIFTVRDLIESIGWDTELGKILNDTGNLNEKQIIALMQQPGFKALYPEFQHVFSFALQHGYDVKVVKPGDKADVYRISPESDS